MQTEEKTAFIRWCMLGAIGGILMAAGDWLLGCVPLQETDTGMSLKEPQNLFLLGICTRLYMKY